MHSNRCLALLFERRITLEEGSLRRGHRARREIETVRIEAARPAEELGCLRGRKAGEQRRLVLGSDLVGALDLLAQADAELRRQRKALVDGPLQAQLAVLVGAAHHRFER